MLLLASAILEEGRGPIRIGAIRIVSQDVFSAEEAVHGAFYRAANAIHITTLQSFVRKQLLFREGDVLDIERLAETERNLRALPFIKSASVTALPPRDGVADVLVVTQDSWTTQPSISLGSKGGKTTYSFALQETDLAGTGSSVVIAYDQQIDRISRMFEFQDPYLFRPFWRGKLLFAENSDGSQRAVEVGRPFYSFEAPWSTDADYESLSSTGKLYADGDTYSTFHQLHREDLLSYGRAIVASSSYAQRWTAGFDSIDDDFTPSLSDPTPLLPDDRKFRYLYATFESVGSSFDTLNYVNRDLRYEDFNLAPRLFLKAAVSPHLLGAARNTVLMQGEASGGFSLGDSSFAQADLFVQSRFDGGPQDTIVSGFIGYVRKLDTIRPQTFVARIQADRGWRLDGDVQFAADGATGLRGYRLHSMTGDQRLILNLEQRFFGEREYLQLFSPGAVVFADAGTAVPKGRSLSMSEMRADVGAGLRIAIARAGNNNILRIDVAYALRRDPSGRGGLLVSFSSSQAFSFSRETPSGD